MAKKRKEEAEIEEIRKESKQKRLERYRAKQRAKRLKSLKTLGVIIAVIVAILLASIYAYEPVKNILMPEPGRYGIKLTVDDDERHIEPGGYASFIISLSNTGDVNDTITLSAKVSYKDKGNNNLPKNETEGWNVSFPYREEKLASGGEKNLTLKITAPITARDGDYAEVKVTAKSEGDKHISKSVMIKAIVLIKEYGINLTCDENERVISANGKALYVITVKNTGEGNGTVTLSVTNSTDQALWDKWDYELSDDSVYLTTNQSVNVTLAVSGDGLNEGDKAVVTVTGSIGPPNGRRSDSVTTITTVAPPGYFDFELEVVEDTLYLDEEQSDIFQIRVTNLGEYTDTVRLKYTKNLTRSDGINWTVYFLEAGRPAVPGDELNVTLEQGETKTVEIYAEAGGEGLIYKSRLILELVAELSSNPDIKEYANLTVHKGIEPGVRVIAPEPQWGDPGDVITLYVTLVSELKNRSNFELVVEPPGGPWKENITIDGKKGARNSEINIDGYKTKVVNVTIRIPEKAIPTGPGTDKPKDNYIGFVACAADEYLPKRALHINNTYIYVNKVVGIELDATKTEANILANNTVEYTITIINEGNVEGDVFNITKEGNLLPGWTATFDVIYGKDVDINQDGSITAYPEPFERLIIELRVTSPADASEGDGCQITVRGTSKLAPDDVAIIIFTTMVVKPKPELLFPDEPMIPDEIVLNQTAWINITVANNPSLGDESAENISLVLKEGEDIIDNETIEMLDAGEERMVSFTWIPASTGNHTLYIIIDPENEIDEEDEENNIVNITVIVSEPIIDLSIEDKDLSVSNDRPNEWTNITITAVVHNLGNVVAENVSVHFIDAFNGNDTIGNMTVSVQKDGKRVLSINWTAVGIGNHTIKVIIDLFNKTKESNESNNIAMINITVLEPLPDLRIRQEDITFSTTAPQENETVEIYAIIYNIGNADATNITVRFFDVFNDNETLIGNVFIELIETGKFGIASVEWTAVGIGNHTIKVVVDPENTISEMSEENNNAMQGIEVSAGSKSLKMHAQQGIINPHVNVRVAKD